MDKKTKELKGSPSRDDFKYYHKNSIDSKYWACDIDLALVDKNPPRVIAILDFKKPKDKITFSEVLAYNVFKDAGLDVYIITGNAQKGAFIIEKYIRGNFKPEPPIVEKEFIQKTKSWDDYNNWEGSLRGFEIVEPSPMKILI